ncbi:anti-sigma factor [Arthrobacter sp. JSM 101049]|uniref:anti-sigma factor family protein n=1 Tax=Arthrobacter sp. JSM 101049 TaxID=929097 RepID=UPI0035638F60
MFHRHARRIDDYLDGELDAGQRGALERHVGQCADCRLQLEDRRRLKRRLQSLCFEVPEARLPDDELLGRLRESPWTATPPTVFSAASLDAEGHSSRLRSLAPTLATAAVVAMLAAVVCAAWVLGGAVRNPVAGGGPVAGPWSESAAELSSSDLADLRAAGWNCPTMRAAGLELVRATGSKVDGVDHVTLEFTGNDGDLVLTESRTPGISLLKSPLARPASDVKQPTARIAGVSAPQLRTIDGETVGVAPVAGGTQLDMRTATYSLRSSLDAPVTEAVVDRVVATEHARLAPQSTTAPGIVERLGRGMSRLLVLDTDH